jgi:hypothetical protein
LNEPIAGGAKEMDTLFSDTIPSPFEHLGDHGFIARQVSMFIEWIAQYSSLPLFWG